MPLTRRGRYLLGAAVAVLAVAGMVLLLLLGGHDGAASQAAPVASSAPATTSASPTPSPTPTSSSASPTSAPKNLPARVVVTTANGKTLVDAPVKPQGLDADGVLAPPPGVVGWYDEPGWPKPGDPGASILAGHINTAQNGDDTFAELPQVAPGSTVTVTYDTGRTVTFEVTRSAGMPKSQTPKDDSIWDAGNPKPLIRLITCDPSTPLRAGHYEGNWVVWGQEQSDSG